MRLTTDLGPRWALTILILAAAAPAATVYRVDADAIGGNDGSDWPNAFPELHSALAVAQNGDEVWVAEGTYRPDYDAATGLHTGDRFMAFVLFPGVALYGGFAGNETIRSERDPAAHPTTLSGDLAGDDGPEFTNRADNSYHVIGCIALGTPARLDGFIITGGHADALCGLWSEGGGLYHEVNRKSFVANCTFTANYARWGGAIGSSLSGAYESTLSRCTFIGNKAASEGGAINIVAGSLTLTDCAFAGNLAGGSGGGISASTTSGKTTVVSVARCTFVGNSAPSGGGGCFAAAALTLSRCEFLENAAGSGGGGGIHCRGPVSANDCVFRRNAAGYGGGGGVLVVGGNPVFNRCIFVGNTAAGGTAYTGGAGMAVRFGDVTLRNCRFTGNVSAVEGGGINATGSGTSSVSLVNCLFNGNSATRGGAAYAGASIARIQMGGCTVVGNSADEGGGIRSWGNLVLGNCIFWGNSAIVYSSAIDHQVDYRHSLGSESINYCCIQGWTAAVGGTGNINVRPAFMDADGLDDVAGTEDDDLRLVAGSPGIDAGDNTLVPSDVMTDLAGWPRFLDDPATADTGDGGPPVVDMGAYEYAPPPPPDLDRDGDVDANDLDAFLACGSGPGVPQEDPDCRSADFDDDGDVDQRDFAVYQVCISGADAPADPMCGR